QTEEYQDDAKAVRQVHQAVQQTVEQEVHLTQTHQGESIGGKYQECFRGNTVNSWDGVKREHDVNQANSDQGDEQWRQGQLALLRARFFALGYQIGYVEIVRSGI